MPRRSSGSGSSSGSSSSGSDSDNDSRKPRSPAQRRKRRQSASPEAKKPARDDDRRDRGPRDNRPLVPAKDPQELARARGKTKTEPNMLFTRAGGAYIPPARLKAMQAQIQDKSSKEFQRMAWQSLKKSINGFINKVNIPNIQSIVVELLGVNLVRGRGLFARACMKAQAASTTFTHVYAALVAIVNTKFPQLGELILKRLVLQFRKCYRRNDKQTCLNSAKFIAHLVNQQVAHEVVALEIMTLLLEKATDDSVEVAIAFLKECGMYLSEVSPRGLHAIFERLRSILHESEVEKRSQYMIEVMFAIRKDGFRDHPAILEGLDLIEESDQITHLIALDEDINPETGLDVFKFDDDYEGNEERYKEIKAEILGDDSSDEDGDDEDSSDDDESDEEDAAPAAAQPGDRVEIHDMTETNLIALRRTIYLTLKSSLDFEEAAHKLLKMTIKPGQESEVCNMIVECCAQERSYIKFFGLLAQRFCQVNREFQDRFVECFAEQYSTVHRLETNKLRQEAKLFAHLFFSDAIPWTAMEVIHLNERDTTSSSRIFIKELFLELSQYMGLKRLLTRLNDPSLRRGFSGLFPLGNPKDTRFAINFFTTIGLGALTDEMRTHLKNAPKPTITRMASSSDSDSDSDSSSSGSGSSSSGSGSSSGSDSGSSSGSADSSPRRRQRRKTRSRSPPSPRSASPRRERAHRVRPRSRDRASPRRNGASSAAAASNGMHPDRARALGHDQPASSGGLHPERAAALGRSSRRSPPRRRSPPSRRSRSPPRRRRSRSPPRRRSRSRSPPRRRSRSRSPPRRRSRSPPPARRSRSPPRGRRTPPRRRRSVSRSRSRSRSPLARRRTPPREIRERRSPPREARRDQDGNGARRRRHSSDSSDSGSD
eukprot:TRINITY_DN9375_c0_g1_i1.p1 TRINITY_DN9375_c0_g1~~TRINITY_DN9375_c0_g1_i1.p1  ORF type:complete len:883 (+),score=172.91 TRINITY_DN9375_c0_g1_i1:61-2709(+)